MPRPKGRRPGESKEEALARIKKEIDEREAAAAARRRQRRPTGAAGPTGRQHQFKTRAEYDETDRRREEWRAEQARKRAHREKYGSALGGHRTTGSRGHGSEYREDYVIDSIINYLISEGYVYDEKSAIAILEAMSDSWLDEVLTEGAADILYNIFGPARPTPQQRQRDIAGMREIGGKIRNAVSGTARAIFGPGPRANPNELNKKRLPQTPIQRDVARRTTKTLGR